MTRGHSVDFRTYDRNAVARKKINFHDVPKSAALAKNNRKEICFIPSAVKKYTGGKQFYRVVKNFTSSGSLASLIKDILLSPSPGYLSLNSSLFNARSPLWDKMANARADFSLLGLQYSFLNNLQNSIFCLKS